MADSFKNTSGQTIPPRGIIQVVGAEQVGRSRVLTAKKPIQTADKDLFYINGPTEIAASKTGRASRGLTATWAAFDPADGTPTFGEEWGPRNGSWLLRKGEEGFIVVGEPNDDNHVLVVQEIGAPEDCPNNFRIIVVGNPTAGSFDLTLVLPDGSDTLTLDWDATAGELETAILAHAHWLAGYEVNAADGPFPMQSISVQLGGDLSGVTVAQPTVSNITLSGGARSGVRVERACCEEAV